MPPRPPHALRARRRALAWLASLIAAPPSLAQCRPGMPSAPVFAPAVAGYVLRFPHDEGSHPAFRTEWWYVTGWLQQAARPLGFQITFFRSRPARIDDCNPSTFAARHVLVAHAAISDPAHGKLLHDQHAARAGFGLAGAGEGRVHVWIDDWFLQQQDGVYRARIPARHFQLELTLAATQPPLLQGADGLSRKGPRAESASYYYSLPHLRVEGTLSRTGQPAAVAGSAWLDHEWSSSYMDKEAAGWDWIGINLSDGGALMAFRMRDRQNGTLWAAATLRDRHGRRRAFAPQEVAFVPQRTWRSPHTGTRYPVAWRVKAGALEIELEPMMDDQENDVRASTGTVYWEGAVRALQHGRLLGLGYLELTGYWRPMNF